MTESLPVRREKFVEGLKQTLGMRGHYRGVTAGGDALMLREPAVAYSRLFDHGTGLLDAENGVFWG